MSKFVEGNKCKNANLCNMYVLSFPLCRCFMDQLHCECAQNAGNDGFAKFKSFATGLWGGGVPPFSSRLNISNFHTPMKTTCTDAIQCATNIFPPTAQPTLQYNKGEKNVYVCFGVIRASKIFLQPHQTF